MGAALAFVSLGFASCVAPRSARTTAGFVVPPNHAPSDDLHADSVILVAIDGTRWQDVFEGPPDLMPTLERWMTTDGVAIGAPGHGEMWASGPNYISMPGYTEMLTGRPSACQTNGCGNITTPTLVDQVMAGGGEAAVISSWELIARVAAVDSSRVTMSTGRHVTARTEGLDPETLQESRQAEAWPGTDDYRPDDITARVALGLLDRRLPRFAFFGLGDTDEHAHHNNRDRYYAALRAADQFLSEVEKRVTPRTVIMVTADHGRSASFCDHGGGDHDSGRVWMVVRALGLGTKGLVDAGRVRLADVAPTVRCLLELPRDVDGGGTAIGSVCGG